MEIDRLRNRFRRRKEQHQAKIQRRELKTRIMSNAKLRASLIGKMMNKVTKGLDASTITLDVSDPRLAPGYVMSFEENEALNEEHAEASERMKKICNMARHVYDSADVSRAGQVLPRVILNAMKKFVNNQVIPSIDILRKRKHDHCPSYILPFSRSVRNIYLVGQCIDEDSTEFLKRLVRIILIGNKFPCGWID